MFLLKRDYYYRVAFHLKLVVNGVDPLSLGVDVGDVDHAVEPTLESDEGTVVDERHDGSFDPLLGAEVSETHEAWGKANNGKHVRQRDQILEWPSHKLKFIYDWFHRSFGPGYKHFLNREKSLHQFHLKNAEIGCWETIAKTIYHRPIIRLWHDLKYFFGQLSPHLISSKRREGKTIKQEFYNRFTTH